MKNLLLPALLLILSNTTSILAQQWSQVGQLPFASRYDDIYFQTADLGWAVSAEGTIHKTEDGGNSWAQIFSNNAYYLRSVEFLDEQVGFAGSLNSILLKTEDGGDSWTQIQDLIPVAIPGICGLSHFGDNVYGVGIWSYPAYFVKSEDRGQSWTHQDLSDFADGLVECHFINEELGFASGIDEDAGAVILKTTDGGDNWELVLDTQGGAEYIWKLDFVTDDIGYGVIESFFNAARIVKTTDGGDNWEILEVTEQTLDLQGIGFIDENRGWVGPRNTPMYETMDGGQSWAQNGSFPNINRFFRVSSNLVYASGYQVYKFDNSTVSTEATQDINTEHSITTISPNPFSDHVNVIIDIDNNTYARIDLLNASGQMVQHIHKGRLTANTHQFEIDLSERSITDGSYFLVLRTNEGFITKQLIKGEAND